MFTYYEIKNSQHSTPKMFYFIDIEIEDFKFKIFFIKFYK